MSRSTDRRVPVRRRGRAQKRSGRVKTALAVALLGLVPAVSVAQEPGREDSGDHGDRMVMPTEDAKVHRLARPTVAALQAKLSLTGHFEGAVNGLYGPSTREAMAAWQEAKGRTATGWPDLTAVLALMGAERGLQERFADRIDLRARPGAGERGASILPGDGTVAGDPQPAKRIRPMPGRMAAENDPARALRALRALIGAVQLRLAEATPYAGPITCRPDEPGVSDALAAWQRSEGLEPTGKLDLATSLRLLDLDPDRLARTLGGPVRMDESPVSMDRELMEESLNRFPSPVRDAGDNDATKGGADGGT